MLERPLLQRIYYLRSQCPKISPICCGHGLQVRSVSSSKGGAEENGFKKKGNLNFPEKTVTVYSCENIYDKWKKERTFYRIPKSGIYATMRYIDTLEQTEKTKGKRQKTVLIIHGIPGNYGIFSSLIKALSDNGVRVVVPTFPQTLFLPGKYQKELFRHSLEEKTQVFKDFLKAAKVSEVDCIISHSSGIYPALQLMKDPDIKGKCQVFFNTGGHKPTVTMRPYWAIRTIIYLYLNSFTRIFIQKTGRFLMKHILRTPIRNDDVDGIALLGVTMVFSKFWKTKDIFDEIAKKEIPTLYIFSEDDKVVEKELTYQILSLLGASKENVNFYDEMGKLQKKGKDLPWLKLLSFKEGSHYVFRKHPEVCNEEVLQLLQKIKLINENSSEIKS
ncbi:uncharacterized protein LOC129961012 [Argiope bruennichi]|uniref:Uncharacterized protein n=1 Tax=Argiope bruennichi TaxID=94029 RepID=A0A8T0FJL3_ARGBR|nr:uncharacterized protein LOC129961012 [Argiope bruennichi]KAF8791126.1 hypothetical protein HNY73_006048 [Argiope bruennichi]